MANPVVVITIEITQSERAGVMERFREFFLERGFVVDREGENHVELSRPVPKWRKNKEILYYPAFNKIQIQLIENSVEFRCELSKVYQYRIWLILLSVIIDLGVLFVLFFVLNDPRFFFGVAGLMVVSVIVAIFVFFYLPRQSIEALSQDLQSVLG